MSVKRNIGFMAVVLGAVISTRGADWEVQKAPLMTRWAKEVTPETAWREYPRPQMVREDWLSLNGLWDYQKAVEGQKKAGKVWEGKVLVPFPMESALSGVMKHLDRIWYRKTFQVPEGWDQKRVLLHFDAVDWGCTVYVNKKRVGQHRGGYDAFTLDVTDAIKKDAKDQEITMIVWDPTDGGDQPRGKQVVNPKGIFYTPTSGIWQSVWLEPVPAGYVHGLKIVPDVDKGEVEVVLDMGPQASGSGQLSITVTDPDDNKVVAEGSGFDVRLKIPNAKLWSPDSPHLYDIMVKAGNDQVKSYFGMRKIEVAKDEKGVNRIMLNGKAVFEVGMLDQGFWPDGIYTAPTDAALKFDIEQQKKLGFNLIRKHVKVEPARWYYWTDKLGMLVWQDMPSANNKTDKAKEQYAEELTRLIEGHWNSPSIIMWVVFNEGWGQFDTPRITKLAKDLDPTRLVNNASGWTDAGVGDVVDMHNYPGPGCPKTEEKRAAVLGEFGGLGLATPGHLWWEKNFSYQGQGSKEELVKEYSRLLSRAYGLKESSGLSAIVYTQTTDVEGEINGLMTYDRQLKGDAEAIRKANLGQGPVIKEETVVPSAQDGGQTWRYTTDKPGEGWQKEGFDAKDWKEGKSGFGKEGVGQAVIGTKWESADIWARRDVEIPADVKPADLKLWMNHSEDCEVYINGVLAVKKKHSPGMYQEQPISPDAQATIKPGKNVLAVHCRQGPTSQYVDVGILKLVEKGPAAKD